MAISKDKVAPIGAAAAVVASMSGGFTVFAEGQSEQNEKITAMSTMLDTHIEESKKTIIDLEELDEDIDSINIQMTEQRMILEKYEERQEEMLEILRGTQR